MSLPELQEDNGAAVVVGVDSSTGGNHALRWAFNEARLRHAPLRVVHAWTFSHTGLGSGGYGMFGMGPLPTAYDPMAGRIAAEKMIGTLIGEVAGDFPDVEIDVQIIDGGASEVLVGAAAAGDLLVVGSRGHGGFAGLLLGSVSQQCIHHAQCPVVVIHPPQEVESADDGDDQRKTEASGDESVEALVVPAGRS